MNNDLATPVTHVAPAGKVTPIMAGFTHPSANPSNGAKGECCLTAAQQGTSKEMMGMISPSKMVSRG